MSSLLPTGFNSLTALSVWQYVWGGTGTDAVDCGAYEINMAQEIELASKRRIQSLDSKLKIQNLEFKTKNQNEKFKTKKSAADKQKPNSSYVSE